MDKTLPLLGILSMATMVVVGLWGSICIYLVCFGYISYKTIK